MSRSPHTTDKDKKLLMLAMRGQLGAGPKPGGSAVAAALASSDSTGVLMSPNEGGARPSGKQRPRSTHPDSQPRGGGIVPGAFLGPSHADGRTLGSVSEPFAGKDSQRDKRR